MLTGPPRARPDDTRTLRPAAASGCACSARSSRGSLLYVAFPPFGAWWAAPLGLALVVAVVDGCRVRSAFGLGALVGVAYQLPLLNWTGEYVGAVWLLLLVALVVVVALPVALFPLVTRLPGAPVWVACVWVAGEALIERWPFDGFPWAKIAFGQPGGLFAPLASLGGAPLVSFAVALSGAGPVGPRARAARPRGIPAPRRAPSSPSCSGRSRASRRCRRCAPTPRARRSRWPPCRATSRARASTSTPSAGRCSTTTSPRPAASPTTSARAGPPAPTW